MTYKYHRLVHNSGDKPGELPQVERCVVEEGEEDDEEVNINDFLSVVNYVQQDAVGACWSAGKTLQNF